MSSQNDYVVYLNSISTQITYYGLWIIFPTCIVGNLVSLFIYTRPNLNKKTNTGFLYSTLCILNLVSVIYYSLVYRSSVLFKYTVNWPCGVDGYVRRTALNSITWIQVVICLDRFIAVVFPRKRNLMRKKYVLIGIMFACLALILITNMTNLMTYPVTNANNVTSCFTASDVSIATSLIATMMRIFIPFLLMLGLNLLVIYRLKQSKIRVGIANVIQLDTQSRQQQQQPSRQLTRKEFKFTVSTLIIDFLFLFFYLPLGVAFVVQIYNLFNNSLSSYPVGNAVYNLFSNLSQIFALAHTSALFFIFIVFNRNFRTELFDLLRVYKFFPQFKPENTTNQTRVANNQTQFF